jgi:polar amino acid transport system substrate-binding protein
MQGGRPDAVRALLGEANAAARRPAPQTLTIYSAWVLKPGIVHQGERMADMRTILGAGTLLHLCFLCSATSWAQDRILLDYNDRPPYLVPAADGSATGLTATPAANAFKAAGIPVVWVKLPTNRQLLNLKRNSEMECAIGWFKNPEREQFARFTKAIYRDLPTMALANNGFNVKKGMRLEDVLAIKGVRVLAKDNYSYGPFIDGLLAKFKPVVIRTTSENSVMVEMIRANRADFMFVAEEEAKYLAEEAGASVKEFQMIKFSDMPMGEKRYIMCSKQVPDEIINKLNNAITFE